MPRCIVRLNYLSKFVENSRYIRQIEFRFRKENVNKPFDSIKFPKIQSNLLTDVSAGHRVTDRIFATSGSERIHPAKGVNIGIDNLNTIYYLVRVPS